MKNPFPPRCLMPVVVGIALCALSPAMAENLMIGFNRVTCLAKSDTFVSVPFMKHPVKLANTLGALPTIASGLATLTPTEATTLVADELKESHYIRFTSGALAGHWYDISGNTASSITIDLNGEDGTKLAPGDAFVVVEYWTLDTLFPPNTQTTLHKSSGNLGYQQKSKLLIPNIEGTGTDLPADAVYFVTADGWKKSTAGFPIAGDTILPPGLPFIIRHPEGVAKTDFEPEGRVLRSRDSVVLAQEQSSDQDNTVAVFRPVDVLLSDAGLNENAFASSASHESSARKDQLLVFDNSKTDFNKSPSAIFYKYSQNWFLDDGKAASNPAATSTNVLSASGALIIRKAKGANASPIWNNEPTY